MKLRAKVFFLSATAILLSAPAQAHVTHSDYCNVTLEGNLDHEQGRLSVKTDSLNATFTNDGDVSVDGKTLSLTRAQQNAAQDYYRSITTAVPMTVSIATDAVTIAGGTVTEVFTELLGDDQQLSQEFDEFFNDINERIMARYDDASGNFTVNANEVNDGDWVDQGWDDEFDAKVEDLVSKSLGKILMSVGSNLFNGEQSLTDFAERMSNFGDTIDQRVNARVETLEKQAEILCDTLAQADYAESRLADNVTELANLDVLSVDKKHAK